MNLDRRLLKQVRAAKYAFAATVLLALFGACTAWLARVFDSYWIVVAGLLIVAATWALGHDSDFLESSTSVKIFDRLQSYAQERGHELPDVASPAEWLSD